MEHVYRFLDDANPPKEITPEEFYSFCKNMPDTQSIRFCVVWSVSWYHYVSSNYAYTPDAFAQLGAFCRAFPDLSERGVDVVSDCFGSIGNQLWADRMLRSDDAIALCAGAVTHAREEALCTLGAASAFVRVGNTKEVPALCGSLGDEENKAQRCLLYAGYE